MKLISSNELRSNLDKYLVQVAQEEIIIAINNGSFIKISPLDIHDLAAEENFENDPRFEQIIQARRDHYQKHGGVPLARVQQALIEELIADLNHSDSQTRYEAVQHLIRLGESVIPVLQEVSNQMRTAAVA